jgi:E3 ubiquitin-protein ligase RNF183
MRWLGSCEGSCWLLAAGCWLLAAGCWLLAAGCWLLAAGYWLLAAGARGNWQLAIGSSQYRPR